MIGYIKRVSLICFAIVACSCGVRTSNVNDWAELLEKSTPQEFTPIKPKEWKLSNGLSVIFSEDRELPVVQGALFTKGGGFGDPVDKVGISAATGILMRQGGAHSIGPDALDRELEDLSAGISTSISGEYGKFSFSCLSADSQKVMQLFAAVVLSPRFDESRIALWRGQMIEGIRRRTDDSDTVGSLSLSQLVFGESPFGRVAVDQDIQRIVREDLIARHSKLVQPEGSILTIAGAISEIEARQLVEANFGRWKQTTATEKFPQSEPVSRSPGVYFVELPFEQATIIAGQLGPKRLSPDYVAIDGLNELLSGGFASRLFKRIRTELGLAYAVSGGITPGAIRGLNSVVIQTKGQSAGEALIESIKILKEVQLSPPGNAELQDVKRSISNSLLFRFATPQRIVERSALLRILDYPEDYDSTYMDKVLDLSPEALEDVAMKRWDLDNLIVVVVGDSRAYSSLQKVLSELPAQMNKTGIVKLKFDQKARL